MGKRFGIYRQSIKQLWHGMTGWGYWPVMVMLGSQLALAKNLGRGSQTGFHVLTAAGTLTIYGLDRLVERRVITTLAPRHRSVVYLDRLTLALVGLLLALSLCFINSSLLIWASILTLGGLLYLAVTTAYWPLPPGCKEALGAVLFAVLLWGPYLPNTGPLPGALLSLGFANFAWSSFQDQDRDRANKIPNLYVALPKLTLPLARACAGLAAVWFVSDQGLGHPLAWVALAHSLWPPQHKWSVDWAFLPILIPIIQAFRFFL